MHSVTKTQQFISCQPQATSSLTFQTQLQNWLNWSSKQFLIRRISELPIRIHQPKNIKRGDYRERARREHRHLILVPMPCKGLNWGTSNPQWVSVPTHPRRRAEIITKASVKQNQNKQTQTLKSPVKMCLWACPRGHSWPWEWCTDDLTELQTQARKCFARVFRIGSWHPRDVPRNQSPNETQERKFPPHHNTTFGFNEPFYGAVVKV